MQVSICFNLCIKRTLVCIEHYDHFKLKIIHDNDENA